MEHLNQYSTDMKPFVYNGMHTCTCYCIFGDIFLPHVTKADVYSLEGGVPEPLEAGLLQQMNRQQEEG